ncbi:hypothetical protein [Blastopirellula marina]|uniref:SLA1 homology domain-containing protein n=1 Tax=Blastopirellula marina TaxID=124 RepID=A0A2S8G1V6_9BACT|nr:hypothetical protein [Blastopirellula marina]PQO38114.1 hypothetical protein C5Y98_08520 [Blastopirellula marina]PTL44770.1 hypothetical protein C5Y97_08520 [Blastopirellula marina]
MLTPQTRIFRLGLALLVGSSGLFLSTSAQAREWTTADGKSVEAELVEIVQDGKAVVLDVKGKRYEVSLERLSIKDQAYIEGLQDAARRPSDAQIAKDLADDIAEDSKKEAETPKDEPDTIRLKVRRMWHSREGAALEAQFVRMRGSIVLLKVSGFKYDSIDYYNLSTEDRQFIYDAHAAMGKADLIPPVRADLVDAAPSGMEAPAYQEHPPTPAQAPMTPAASPKSTDTASSDGSVSLPPNGFGSVEKSEPEISLPANGFGAVDTTTPEPSPFDSDVKLPSSGFGNVPNPTSDGGEVHGVFTPVPNDPPKKVGLPNSTIVDSSMETETNDDRPLFDVASVPNAVPKQTSGFGEYRVDPNPVAKSNPTPQPVTSHSSPPKPSGNNQFGTSASGGSARPQQSPGGSSNQGTPQFGNSQTFTDFTPIEPPAPREFTTADWNLQIFAVILLSGGCLMMAGGYMWLIALAFIESLEWGLRSLIPGMAIMFGVSEWEKASVPLLTMLLGVCLTLGGFGLLLGVS